MTAFRRIDKGGLIDRGKPIGFTFDGKPLSGFAGDTLASALLANGKTLIARSFKYHRPRGIMSAGVEEANGLFTINGNEPNVPATMVDLVEGLHAASQNAWPSVDFDLMAMNSLAAPLLQTGFYYKTFMGPFKKSWMLYEPFIRRAAGIGKGKFDKDPDRYDTRHEFCDVLVVGSGPAGLTAALAAARSGARVALVEQDSDIGGQLLSEADRDFAMWRAAQADELRSLPNVTVRTRTTAQGLYDDNLVVLAQRHDTHDAGKGKPRLRLISLRAKSIIFATGAIERPLVFSNNDRPGVMLASAVRTYLNRFGIAPLKRTLIVTNNDTAYKTAFDLAEAGIAVTMADHRNVIPSDLLSRAAMMGMAMFPGTGIADVEGAKQVSCVQLAGSHSATIECDVLAMSGGWNPVVHLTSHGGIKPVYSEAIAAFVPGGYAKSHFGAGAATGKFGFEAAIKDGHAAGSQAAIAAGFEKPEKSVAAIGAKDRAYKLQAQWQPKSEGKGKAFVDFQSDVTLKDVRDRA